MISSSLVVASVFFWPAQEQNVQPSVLAARQIAASPVSERAEVYRQIGVMKQLLRRQFGAPGRYSGALMIPGSINSAVNLQANSYLSFVQANANPFGRGDGTVTVDGVYLPDYGVVFTVGTAEPVRPPRNAAEKSAPKAVSEWERAEKELKGELVEAAPAQEAPPSTIDTIARLLADNGRHFTTLRDDERIAVVVTFHDAGASPLLSTYGTAANLYGADAAAPHKPGSRNGPGIASMPGVPGGPGSAFAPGTSAAPAQDYELLADMHLKQKRFDDALSAYGRAVARLEAEAKANPSDENQRRLAALLLKQAQALTATDQTDAAMKLLRRIAAINAGGDPVRSEPAKNKPAGQHTPSKLIVSATKRLLSDVGGGKISFDEFRKGLAIEDLTKASR